MDSQIEIRKSSEISREASPRKTFKEVLDYYSGGQPPEARLERADFFGLTKEQIAGVPVSELRQKEREDKVFSLDEEAEAVKYAESIGGWVEKHYGESIESDKFFIHVGYISVRWETLEEVKERILAPDYRKELKEEAAKLQEKFAGAMTLENFDVDLSELTMNNLTLICSESGIHSIERSKTAPLIDWSKHNLRLLK